MSRDLPLVLVLIGVRAFAAGPGQPDDRAPVHASRSEISCAILFADPAADAKARWKSHLRRFVAEPLLTAEVWTRYTEELLALPDPEWTPAIGRMFVALRRAWRTKPLDNPDRKGWGGGGPNTMWGCDANYAVGVIDMRELLVLPEWHLRRVIDVEKPNDDEINTNRAVLAWGDSAPTANYSRPVRYYGRLEQFRHRVTERLVEAGSGSEPSRTRAFRLAVRWGNYNKTNLVEMNMPGRFEAFDEARPWLGKYPREYAGIVATEAINAWAKANGHPLRERSLRHVLDEARTLRHALGFANGVPRNHRRGMVFPRGGTEALLGYLDPERTPPRYRREALERAVRVELTFWPLSDRQDPFAIEDFDPQGTRPQFRPGE